MVLRPSLFLEENISFINCYFNMNNKNTKDMIIEITSHQTSMVLRPSLSLEENLMMNNFILATWQKGSRQSSCSSTRRASPRPPQTRPLHTVSTRSTFTSSYSQNVFSDETSTWKKSWWLPWDPEHWSDWKSHQGQGRLPKLSRRRPYLQPITFRLK